MPPAGRRQRVHGPSAVRRTTHSMDDLDPLTLFLRSPGFQCRQEVRPGCRLTRSDSRSRKAVKPLSPKKRKSRRIVSTTATSCPLVGLEPAHSAGSKGLVGRPRTSRWASTGRAPSAGPPTARMIRTNLRFFFAGPVVSAAKASSPGVACQRAPATLEWLSSYFRQESESREKQCGPPARRRPGVHRPGVVHRVATSAAGVSRYATRAVAAARPADRTCEPQTTPWRMIDLRTGRRFASAC